MGGSRTRGDDMAFKAFEDCEPNDIKLLPDALDKAVEAAQAEHAASDDAHEELKAGIKAYLHAWATLDPDVATVLDYIGHGAE